MSSEHSGHVYFATPQSDRFAGYHGVESGMIRAIASTPQADGSVKKDYHITNTRGNKFVVPHERIRHSYGDANDLASELTKQKTQKESIEEATESYTDDKRYKISQEFTGHASGKKQHVVRFAKEFVSSHSTKDEAQTAAQQHKDDRNHSFKFESKQEQEMNIEEAVSPESAHRIISMYGVKPSDSFFEHDSDTRNNIARDGKRLGIKHNASSRASGKSEGRHIFDRLTSIAAKHKVQTEQTMNIAEKKKFDDADMSDVEAARKKKQAELQRKTAQRQPPKRSFAAFAEAIATDNMKGAKSLFETLIMSKVDALIEDKKMELAEEVLGEKIKFDDGEGASKPNSKKQKPNFAALRNKKRTPVEEATKFDDGEGVSKPNSKKQKKSFAALRNQKRTPVEGQ